MFISLHYFRPCHPAIQPCSSPNGNYFINKDDTIIHMRQNLEKCINATDYICILYNFPFFPKWKVEAVFCMFEIPSVSQTEYIVQTQL